MATGLWDDFTITHLKSPPERLKLLHWQGQSHGNLFALTIDDSIIVHPNIYLNSAMEVHGICAILDYTVNGGDFFAPPVILPFFPTGKVIGGRRSDARCMCTEFPMVFSIVCAVFAFKILRNPLAR
ncbi:unnamed protein product [Ilex paraguariensis]|uniref:Uncharacterized protein n=1 Tax=Ilex paraguariensis TaxID=185542 RepID=A0ABC8SXN8_9AQUA